MKTQASLLALAAALALSGCAGPAVRHDIRMDRRQGAAYRSYNRQSTRQYNRYDRQTGRQGRMDYRFGAAYY